MFVFNNIGLYKLNRTNKEYDDHKELRKSYLRMLTHISFSERLISYCSLF